MAVRISSAIHSSRVMLTLVIALLTLTTTFSFLSPDVNASLPSAHAPILINGNSGFTAANGVIGGNGSQSDPYLIQGWNIVTCCDGNGLVIENTSAYFAVRHVTVQSSDYTSSGIGMSNVTNGALENSTVFGYGQLSIKSSKDTLVSGDSVYSSSIDSSQNITITGLSRRGLLTITSSDIITLGDSSLVSGQLQVNIVNSTKIDLENNALSQILVRESSPQQFDTIAIAPDNTVNGEPLLFYKDCSKLNLRSPYAAELLIGDCNDVRVTNFAPIGYSSTLELAFVSTATLNNITGAGSIFIYDSNHVKVTASNERIDIDGSNNVQVIGNSVTKNVFGVIAIAASTNVSIRGNLHYTMTVANSSNVTLTGNDLSPRCCTTDFTSLSLKDADHVTMLGNIFHSDLDIIARNSDNLKIAGNEFMFAALSSIDLGSCSDVSVLNNLMLEAGGERGGVLVNNCSNLDFSGNNMTNVSFCCVRSYNVLVVSNSANLSIEDDSIINSKTAVRINSSSNVTIAENVLQSNVEGVVLKDTSRVHVFHNNFLNNTIQAVETYSTGNVWDNGYPSGGNYWSNYTGTDADRDGIGDTPYMFNYNQDRYPLMQPFPMPSGLD